MSGTDEIQLRNLCQSLEPICSHASVRFDGQTPLLFAVAKDMSHSIDLRRKGNELVIEFWFGYPDDNLVREQRAESFAAALTECTQWLLKGTA